MGRNEVNNRYKMQQDRTVHVCGRFLSRMYKRWMTPFSANLSVVVCRLSYSSNYSHSSLIVIFHLTNFIYKLVSLQFLRKINVLYINVQKSQSIFALSTYYNISTSFEIGPQIIRPTVLCRNNTYYRMEKKE